MVPVQALGIIGALDPHTHKINQAGLQGEGKLEQEGVRPQHKAPHLVGMNDSMGAPLISCHLFAEYSLTASDLVQRLYACWHIAGQPLSCLAAGELAEGAITGDVSTRLAPGHQVASAQLGSRPSLPVLQSITIPPLL